MPEGPRESSAGFRSASIQESGTKARIRSESFNDHYSQARQFFISQTEHEQAHMASALVFELSKVEHVHIRLAMIGHLQHIDSGLAQRVAKGLGVSDLPEPPHSAAPVQNLDPSPALQTIGKMKHTLEGRAVGILVSEGSDWDAIDAIVQAVSKEGASHKIIAPHVGEVVLADQSRLKVHGQLAGTPSVMFDAVAVVLSADAASELCNESAAVDFLRDAFGHLKAIAYDDGAQALLDKAGVVKDDGVVSVQDIEPYLDAAKTRQWAREKSVRTLA
jgi:catalase